MTVSPVMSTVASSACLVDVECQRCCWGELFLSLRWAESKNQVALYRNAVGWCTLHVLGHVIVTALILSINILLSNSPLFNFSCFCVLFIHLFSKIYLLFILLLFFPSCSFRKLLVSFVFPLLNFMSEPMYLGRWSMSLVSAEMFVLILESGLFYQ